MGSASRLAESQRERERECERESEEDWHSPQATERQGGRSGPSDTLTKLSILTGDTSSASRMMSHLLVSELNRMCYWLGTESGHPGRASEGSEWSLCMGALCCLPPVAPLAL